MDIKFQQSAFDSKREHSVLVLFEDIVSDASVDAFISFFASEMNVFCLKMSRLTKKEIETRAEQIVSNLQKEGAKRFSLISFGEYSGKVAQTIALDFPKLVRRVMLVNATMRIQPNSFFRIAEWFEEKSPFGLPFGREYKEFDSRSLLHRIQCPVLVAVSKDATEFEERSARGITKKIPNSFLAAISSLASLHTAVTSELLAELKNIISPLLEIPTKCPQKNLARQ